MHRMALGFPPCRPLAAGTAPNGTESFGPIVLYSLALIGLIVILFAALIYIKKKWTATDQAPMVTGFTLSDLRTLHEQGKMSDEEFERAKAKMLAGFQRK